MSDIVVLCVTEIGPDEPVEMISGCEGRMHRGNTGVGLMSNAPVVAMAVFPGVGP